MTNAGFEKVGNSGKRLYGERKLLLCGFAAAAQSKFKTLLEMIGIEHLPLVWAVSQDLDVPVSDLFERPEGSGENKDSSLPRSIIVAGLEEQELHLLMSGCKRAGMQQALWAVLTPTSEKWSLAALLNELAAERTAMSKGR